MLGPRKRELVPGASDRHETVASLLLHLAATRTPLQALERWQHFVRKAYQIDMAELSALRPVNRANGYTVRLRLGFQRVQLQFLKESRDRLPSVLHIEFSHRGTPADQILCQIRFLAVFRNSLFEQGDDCVPRSRVVRPLDGAYMVE